MDRYEAVVVGVSAGGLYALGQLLGALRPGFPLPVAIVQHVMEGSDGFMAEYLNGLSKMTVKEAVDKERMRPGCAYVAPAGYHMLLEEDGTFSLSIDPKVNYSRPSIDVLFESAAFAFRSRLIGVILTGANHDGSAGLREIKRRGGLAIVQDPETAEFPAMPRAALEAAPADYILPIGKIGEWLNALTTQ